MVSNPTEPRLVNRWTRWTLHALLPTTLLLYPRAARAEDTFKPPPKLPAFLHLEYDRGALKGCPEREALEDAIIAAAGRDPLNDVAPARLRVAITRRGAAYAAIIEVRDAAGALVWRRPWDAPLASCTALVSALGFLVGSELREVPPASSQAPAPAPAKVEAAPVPALVPAMPAPDQAKADLPPAPSHAPIRLNVGAASAVGIRTAAPLVTFNLTASAGLRWRSFSGALEFRWTPPEDAVVNSVGRELVHVMQYAGRVVPCGHFRALVYCGVGEVSAIVTKGALDTMAVTAATMPSVATGLRLGADAVGTPGPAEGVTQYWGRFVRTCYGKGWNECDNPQGSCIPWGTQPSPDFRLCIIHEGDVPDACEARWPERFTIYRGVKDDRHCTKDCACGPPMGGMCVAHASVYENSDATCGGPTVANLGNISLSSVMPTCNDINPPGQPLGSKSATAPTYLPGACDVIPGVADGEAVPLEPSTLCCRTEPLR